MSREPTICPNCGAQDSLQQSVQVEMSGWRPIRLTGPNGSRKVNYGPVETDFGDDHVTSEDEIECSSCRETWHNEKALLDVGPPLEHRCTACDWWGFNDFTHGLERPNCSGLVYRIDKPPAEVAA
jgi:hypothetical protein